VDSNDITAQVSGEQTHYFYYYCDSETSTYSRVSKAVFFYTDMCLTFELLHSMTSNVILFECQLSLSGDPVK
jgi:hypothetical protein